MSSTAGSYGAAAGGIMGFWGALEQGEAEQAAYNYSAGMELLNAGYTEQTGRLANRALARKITQTIGSARAQYAASGIDVTQGSAADIVAESAAEGARDLAYQAHNYAMKAFSQRSQSAIETYKGASAKVASEYAAIGSGLSAAGAIVGLG